MPSLLERLRDALAPRYEIEGEVASGGMATVFRAVDQSLGRVVAVKVLRPEMATATGEARFLREARTMASFSHPNVVSIHDADQRDGLSYYVMDLVEGGTLAQRLEQGPLSGRDAFRLGRGLLRALGRMHEAGIVHRDVKPSNVFLVDGRALLADFGIVHVEEPEDESLTMEGSGPGTPAYMSPEQARGGQVSFRSDLYSAGLVLYEAISGRRWPVAAPPETGDWSGIPMAARPALKKALAVAPGERWMTADEFLASFRTRGRPIRMPRWHALLLAVAIGALVWWGVGRPGLPRPPATAESVDVALFPCEATDPDDAEAAERLAWRAAINLEGVPGISIASKRTAFSLYERRDGELVPSDWTAGLGASYRLRCVVDRTPSGMNIQALLIDASGTSGHAASMPIAGDSEGELLRRGAVSISLYALDALAPDVRVTEDQLDRLSGYPIEVILPLFLGDRALRRGAWREAEANYRSALTQDSTFALARLQLAEVQRWMADRPIGENLASVRRMDISSLSPLDSLLLEAGLVPHGPQQFAAYEDILARREYQRNPYVTLLYADALYHRGSLWGIPLDSAVRTMRRAVRRDSSLVPAVEHLTQALIRTGQEEEALAALSHLEKIHPPPETPGLYYPKIWGQGFLEKFDPEAARVSRGSMADLPVEELGLYARWVRYIDSPSTQAELGTLLVRAADREGDARYAAQGFSNRGLGLIAQGLIEPGIASFDSAAARFETDETLTQAAEWAVIPHALGVHGFSERAAERGERALEAVWIRPGIDVRTKARAATALALLAMRRGDVEVRDLWTDRLAALGPAPTPSRPIRLVSALADAERGDYRAALDLTAEDLAYDSIGLAERPFLRSALYLSRGEWYRALGMPDSAIASWLWHQNTDLEGTVLPELVQAGEVDGALGPFADRRTAAVRATAAIDTSARPN
jgi:tetratricopeptide (TPR) repeat protein